MLMLALALAILPATITAVTCGGTDDQAALQDALNGATVVELPDSACAADNLTLAHNTEVRGTGPSSKIIQRSGQTGAVVNCSTYACDLHDFEIDGGVTTSWASTSTSPNTRTGIQVSGGTLSKLTALNVHGFGLEGIRCGTAGGRYSGGVVIDNVELGFNWRNLLFEAACEYPRASNVKAHHGRYGVEIRAGNVLMTNPVATENYVALHLYGTGNGNHGHGSVVGGALNHSTGYSIKCVDITYGFEVPSVQIHDGDIDLYNCSRIHVSGEFGFDDLVVTGGTNNVFRGTSANAVEVYMNNGYTVWDVR